jgi:hypothetical protein
MKYIKIYILLIVVLTLEGCLNNISSDDKQQIKKVIEKESYQIKVIAKDFNIKLMSCSLKIPFQYKLQSFSVDEVHFVHKEAEEKRIYEPKNFILSHRIYITNKINLNINMLLSDLKFISEKKFDNINVSRYKPKKLKNIDKSNPIHIEHEKMYIRNNTFFINGKDFSMIINETDEYIDEVYKMIEDCASQLPRK